MDNKNIYFHNFKNTNKAILAISHHRSVFIIDFGNGGTEISLNSDGYYLYGKELPSSIKIYFDKTNNKYYVTKEPNGEERYISIKPIEFFNQGKMVTGYGDDFDESGTTELKQINKNDYPIKNEKKGRYVGANVVSEFVSSLPEEQYVAQSSLVLISFRTDQGVGGSGVYLLSRKNEGSIENFVLTPLHADNVFESCNLTGTKKGFSMTHTRQYHYSVTEIMNMPFV